ncbi:tRNA lysidine(34) synthetase TilS [Candidatus Dependentiae bacterium]|nr:tRNA lysidine(34) synthetase TilS [Candidatus Dependentiae bacterium]
MSDNLTSIKDISSYFQPNSTVIVGFSGGPDSVCLLNLVTKLVPSLNLTIIAAHLDHGWRKESALDAAWCKNMCQELGVTFIGTTTTELNYTPKYNGSKEELGRRLRRYFFEKLAQEYNASSILLAHHADDQIETFFIRLLRGSSISGISGMRIRDRLYLRPLLNWNKSDIYTYLKQEKLSYLQDHTNLELNFLRNRIRLNLLPTLSTIDARWKKTIPSCIKQLQDTDNFLQKYCNNLISEISNQNDSTQINIIKFLALDEIIQHRILLLLLINQKIQFTPTTALFAEIIRFLKSNQSNRHTINSKNSILKRNGYFIFSSSSFSSIF